MQREFDRSALVGPIVGAGRTFVDVGEVLRAVRGGQPLRFELHFHVSVRLRQGRRPLAPEFRLGVNSSVRVSCAQALPAASATSSAAASAAPIILLPIAFSFFDHTYHLPPAGVDYLTSKRAGER